MARDGHDYDMGCHAPWCAACGAEDDARQDAESEFESQQDADLREWTREVVSACRAVRAHALGKRRDEALETLISAIAELEDVAGRTFEWEPRGYDYDGPDTLEEARGER